jgi:hypothetical protein
VTGFSVVRTLTVRRDFSEGPEAGALTVKRDCGLGCTCGGTIYKTAGPSARLAEDKTLCFNDRTKEGISEISGCARLVPAPPGVTAYEVQAHLKQHNVGAKATTAAQMNDPERHNLSAAVGRP